MYIGEQLARESGRDYALRIIKENIIRLELEPGSSISDREIAACLSLSRTPVREALLELAKSKVVDIYPQKGSVVSLIDYELVEEAYFVRNVLESAVVELACEKAGDMALEELESSMRLQRFPIPEMCANSESELKEKVDKWLDGLIEIINKPLCQCPECRGTGYIGEIEKGKFDYREK